jgi:hypothetical protein
VARCCAVVVTWAAAANYNEGRAPAERTRSWFGTAVVPGVIIVTAVSLAVPKADWRSLTFYIPSARILGLVILLAATAFTLWGPARARRHVERRATASRCPSWYPVCTLSASARLLAGRRARHLLATQKMRP